MSFRKASLFLIGALLVLAASVYHAATTPWDAGVWNKVNAPDMSLPIVRSAGENGKIYLRLGHVTAEENVNNIDIYISGTVRTPKHSAPARAHVDTFDLLSKGYSGDRIIDVSEKFKAIVDLAAADEQKAREEKEAKPQSSIEHLVVYFEVTPKNRMVRLTEKSFQAETVYFEIFDAAGNPVPQARKPLVKVSYAAEPPESDDAEFHA